MEYLGWAKNVNKIILDSTQISFGDSAVKSDNLETGKKKFRLTSSNPPKTYQVTMDFDWLEKDSSGLTEKDRFFNWYQYKLKYSTNCFRFPSILLGNDSNEYEWYKIVNAVVGQKSGNSIRVTMTWESAYEGIIVIAKETATVDHISFCKSYATMYFTDTPEAFPSPSDVSITDGTTAITITGFQTTNSKIRFYYSDLSTGDHTMYFTYNGSTTTKRVVVE